MSSHPDRHKLYIPTRLEDLLSQNRELHSGVLKVASVYGPWLNANRVVFFPEYTDHSIGHTEEVLDTATQLITDGSWEVLTPSDAAVLILSVILHDSGMHLQQHSFARLLDSNRPLLSGFSDRPWIDLWNDYGAEIRRYSARELNHVFGSSEPLSLPVATGNLQPIDYLVIGEFLRRYHHRLAHEIAVWGLPAEEGAIFSLQTLPDHIAELSGVVARSHGITLRSTLEYINRRYRLPVSRDVNAIYLMGVLRIADYIQIQATRAPHQQRVAFQIRSPVSIREWKIHLAIADVSPVHEDPEALYVEVQPADVETFLGFKRWVTNVQQELDTTWAVYGEVYGRYSSHHLDKLGIAYRRIRSNIEKTEEFAERVSFVPVQAAFEAASAELLQLLVGPLYGERPEIGIRELVQNAVDAVRERPALDFSEADGNSANVEAAVFVSLKKTGDQYYLTVSDRGRGMSSEVITNYFLRAGASFRRSEAWRREFEDETGHSHVLRSGRFGVGALAAFLLGDEIEVTTRSWDAPEDRGIHFTAKIESESIQLAWTPASVGTTIRIPITNDTAEELGISSEYSRDSWDWYCLENPVVKREVNGIQLDQKWILPEVAQKILPPGFRRINPEGYDEVHWTFNDVPHLVVNGIRVISSRYRSHSHFDSDPGYTFTMPSVSVFDPDGRLPLDLAREELRTGEYPFQEELHSDVVKDCLAWVLENAPGRFPEKLVSRRTLFDWKYKGINVRELSKFRWSPWLHANEGVGVLTPWHFYAADINHCFISTGYFGRDHDIPEVCKSSFLLNCAFEHSEPGILAATRYLLGSVKYDYNNILSHLPIRGRRIIMRKQHVRHVIAPGRVAKHVRVRLSEEWSEGGWVALKIGDCSAPRLSKQDALKHLMQIDRDRSPGMLAELFLDAEIEPETTFLGDAWRKWISTPLLPYDRQLRVKSLPKAYSALGDYIRAHAAEDDLRR